MEGRDTLALRVIAAFAVGVVLCGIPGCQWPAWSELVGTRDLVGKWESTEARVETYSGWFDASRTALYLCADGRFKAENFPSDLLWLHDKKTTASGTGKWSLEVDQGDQSVNLHWKKLILAEVAPEEVSAASNLIIHRTRREFEVYQYLDDPDSGRIVWFKKTVERVNCGDQ